MALSRRAPQSICDGFSGSVAPQYVCRSCRNHLFQPNAIQNRQFSSAISTASVRRKPCVPANQSRSIVSLKLPWQNPGPPPMPEGRRDPNLPPMEEYVEAQTWDGLELIGHKGHWKDLPPKSEDEFEPWLEAGTAATPPDRTQLLMCMYIAILEVLAAKHMNLDMCKPGPSITQGHVTALKIKLSNTGTLSHLEDSKGILDQEQGDDESSENQAVDLSIPDITEQLSAAKFDFNDRLTFNILKRFSQLSKHRIPDPILNTVLRKNMTVTALIGLLTQSSKPKPKSVAEALVAKQKKAIAFAARAQLQDPVVPIRDVQEGSKQTRKLPQPLGPNVMVLSRRETPVDKEKEVGRWKVIERELRDRGLPVLGHKNLTAQRELRREPL
ncbi:uncharacterized protein Z518_08399 [Rhinocladiella mackenziei CBS 650.93]|uniref:Large ribosomal subunit protein mL50 n=1 Tax=Rhinocladiella mackenziei CBS 650.93 TaxID=1442369 RepID=A0A0D2GW46_9EURO|nr:uncharacterized protein Z518_08399 [Rhinocladiella mackenziei CBS 650.93]KIX02458.1 hypothetical protein Z518_08399 [Rhinocladiella mackenziei CBS 650.93]